MRTCNCGSGLPTWVLSDARGIYIARVCDQCCDQVKRGYRPEIFTNANYEADEPIEPDD